MTNSHQSLENLLAEMVDFPERQTEIFGQINDTFGQEKAVLILDMSGFCRTARRHNIVLVLSMIYQMQQLLKPCVETAGGILIKAEADNLFCLFDTVNDALHACRHIRNCLDTTSPVLPEDCRLNVSIGIGYGHILNVGNKDIFGSEVNLASKLGEDIASAGEVLLTENALAKLELSDFQLKAIEISGVMINYHVYNLTN